MAEHCPLCASAEPASAPSEGAGYVAEPQVGPPGKCMLAQVFAPGPGPLRAVLTIEPTADATEANRLAEFCAAALNRAPLPEGWTDDQMVRFGGFCLLAISLKDKSVAERLEVFREQEKLRGSSAPTAPALQKGVTEAAVFEFNQFDDFVMVHNKEQPVPWPIAELFVREMRKALSLASSGKDGAA